MARLKELYQNDIIPKMMKDFGYKNKYQVPRLHKIVINMGVGAAKENIKLLDSAVEELALVAGQRPVVRKAKKSIAPFKLRKGMLIGCMVTLRGARMYEFFDRCVNIAFPRVRDFRGVSPNSFDGKGNYTIGITEETIFPEINYDKVEKIKGMNITIVTTANKDEESRYLLKLLGMPFRAS